MTNHNDLREASKQVLLTAMHDLRLPLSRRVDVALQLLKSFPEFLENDPVDHGPWPGQVQVTIRIEGLGNNPPELIQPDPKVQVH